MKLLVTVNITQHFKNFFNIWLKKKNEFRQKIYRAQLG